MTTLRRAARRRSVRAQLKDLGLAQEVHGLLLEMQQANQRLSADDALDVLQASTVLAGGACGLALRCGLVCWPNGWATACRLCAAIIADGPRSCRQRGSRRRAHMPGMVHEGFLRSWGICLGTCVLRAHAPGLSNAAAPWPLQPDLPCPALPCPLTGEPRSGPWRHRPAHPQRPRPRRISWHRPRCRRRRIHVGTVAPRPRPQVGHGLMGGSSVPIDGAPWGAQVCRWMVHRVVAPGAARWVVGGHAEAATPLQVHSISGQQTKT